MVKRLNHGMTEISHEFCNIIQCLAISCNILQCLVVIGGPYGMPYRSTTTPPPSLRYCPSLAISGSETSGVCGRNSETLYTEPNIGGNNVAMTEWSVVIDHQVFLEVPTLTL